MKTVYDGWDTYQTSIVHAIAPLTPEQLGYRPATNLRSVGEIASHIGLGRIGWFERMGAPGSASLARRLSALEDPASIAEARRRLSSGWKLPGK